MRWHRGEPAWVHERFGFTPDNYGVDLLAWKTAGGFMTANHHSRSLLAARDAPIPAHPGRRAAPAGVAVLSAPPRPATRC